MGTVARRRSSADTAEKATERPTRTRRGSAASTGTKESTSEATPSRKASAGGGGFAAWHKKRRESSSNNRSKNEWKPRNGESLLIKFMEEGPYDAFIQHWIDAVPTGTQKSYVCLETFDEECPLCDLGYEADSYALFNVLDLEKPDQPVVKVWKTSPTIADKLEAYSEAPRTSPLNRVDQYFEIKRSIKGKRTDTDIEPLTADIVEKYSETEMQAFTEEELEEYAKDLYSDITDVTKVHTRREIEALIEEHSLDGE